MPSFLTAENLHEPFEDLLWLGIRYVAIMKNVAKKTENPWKMWMLFKIKR
jgi:hypothetical protein